MARTSLLLIVLHLVSLRNVYSECGYSEENSTFACSLKTSSKAEEDEHVRFKRKASDNSISDLRRRLNIAMNKEEPLQANSTPRLSYNSSSAHSFKDGPMYIGLSTSKVNDGKRQIFVDKLSRVIKKGPRQFFYQGTNTNCNFEEDCSWTWRKDIENGFFIATTRSYAPGSGGPKSDANEREGGSFLLLRAPHSETEYHLTSPPLKSTKPTCTFQVWIYQEHMDNSEIRVIIDKPSMNNHTQWVLGHINGSDDRRWMKFTRSIGKVSESFKILLEVVPAKNLSSNATLAFDNLALINCYPEDDDTCSAPHHFRCKSYPPCINNTKICDITKDCEFGEDEMQNCDQMPYGARCSFEEDLCGWYNYNDAFQWARHSGATPTNSTGPSTDHTYMNITGHYVFVNMLKDNMGFASAAKLRSIIFNPPPSVHGNISSQYYNSCSIRFYLHQTGKHKSGLLLQVTELRPNYNAPIDINWSYNDYGDRWVRQSFILPNITHRYFLNFEAKRGLRFISDIAIDDVSLSPECFGLNIPAEELKGYNYYDPMGNHLMGRETHKNFVNVTHYEITTCGATGRFGPTPGDCAKAYSKTEVKVTVLYESTLGGMQKWIVPSEGYYTLLAFGASGGKGSSAMGSSRGAMVRTVVHLREKQELIFLVGQEGSDACEKMLHSHSNSSCRPSTQNTPMSPTETFRMFLNMTINDSGGGGGGATYVFMRNRSKQSIPLVIAAGGGGLGLGRFIDTGNQHGQAINTSKAPVPGKMYGKDSSGAGGGWQGQFGLEVPVMGKSLLEGGLGGKACYNSTDHRGDGGFGGGGGGCRNGGGGGGYAGGDAPSGNSTNGGGGFSFLDPTRSIPHLSDAHPGYNAGPGYVMIIAAIQGCDCDYRCVALDVKRSQVACICPDGWKLDADGKICVQGPGLSGASSNETRLIMILCIILFVLAVISAIFCIMYNRYQIRASGLLQRKKLSGPDLQLNRLRMTSDGMMTEYNPNYEFGGVVYTIRDLKDIPRAQLRLVKALGQGAFGEVYQGFYRQRPCDAVEMPVAVKTLPEMSTSQAEMDFLMEALIMSKFNHANIVHFIGVCFDKHPRFIVLELLAGGDLKNFLRESRPKAERGSSLTMNDLILISIDVCKGCRYLEENRFIHRDLAARNCLLTTKGPGRVVKIADFGMARDVYRSDYYRKGGKAMLPIKWMPPEAFLDGIFSSKTDVWSYGVLLWEIMSMGYMPYTGCANREVMQLVTSGGRLDPPANCPGPIYGLMTQCWHPTPEQRPTFATILERLGYCAQDPDVMNAPLPVFHRPPSAERDSTVMRPMNSDDNCLQIIPQSSDYLIPNHNTVPNPVGSTSSVEKLLPENSDSWETSFIMPNSKSTQPLLTENEQNKDENVTESLDLLLAINNIPNVKVSPVSLPSNILSNHNNNVKSESASLKAGISLDAGALIKQSSPQAKYANVPAGGAGVTGNGVVANGLNITINVKPAGVFSDKNEKN
ncbi:ALK tyrosine kinase receptor isoform X2 [Coccinella septempunctata]|uniref:ALK tyrosine kinase receptor isoform X2 n=1 Tax=Coccinella septempunctata TaxID=41139 RepID=UPI001D061491|nr:ALK tyrosine kinase receptor isoform X2 [Coccinella septempunctata]